MDVRSFSMSYIIFFQRGVMKYYSTFSPRPSKTHKVSSSGPSLHLFTNKVFKQISNNQHKVAKMVSGKVAGNLYH